MVMLGLAGSVAGVGLYVKNLHLTLQARELDQAPPPEPPEHVDTYYRKGLELLEKAGRFAWLTGDPASARASARRAEEDLEKVPRPEAWAAIGRCRALRFDWSGAAAAHERAMAADPGNRFEAGVAHWMRYLLRASALTPEELAKDTGAAESARRAQELLTAFANSPEIARELVAMAIVAGLRGDLKETPPMVENARDIDPTMWQTELVEGWVLSLGEKHEEVLQKMQELLGRFPYVPEARALRAKAFAALGQRRNARGEWAALLELAPDCAEAHLSIGRARRALEEPDAEAAFRQAVELDATLKAYVPAE